MMQGLTSKYRDKVEAFFRCRDVDEIKGIEARCCYCEDTLGVVVIEYVMRNNRVYVFHLPHNSGMKKLIRVERVEPFAPPPKENQELGSEIHEHKWYIIQIQRMYVKHYSQSDVHLVAERSRAVKYDETCARESADRLASIGMAPRVVEVLI
jgi:hypothetical protein